MRKVKPSFPLERRITPIWIYLWLIVFGLMLIMSLSSPDGNAITIVKLSGIVLCLLYVAITSPKDYLLLAAMLATCVADIILANNNIDATGIVVFIITQLLHLLHLHGHELKVPIIIYSIVATALIALDIIFKIIPLLYLACALYAILLVTNLVTAARWRHREPHNPRALVALLGFALFFCCDFCTGISYLSLVGVFPALLYAPANFFVWLFYLPSQILLSNTGKYDIMTSKKVKR